MPKFFAKLSYQGTDFSGWQKQSNANSVQETLEQCLTKVLKNPIEIVGCGRTDAGVHAEDYIAHFEIENELNLDESLFRINSALPNSIAIHYLFKVNQDAHSRFDAYSRSYSYFIKTKKDPFRKNQFFYYPQLKKAKFARLNELANLINEYEDFFPFCKTHTDVKHYKCKNLYAQWIINEDATELEFQISANRFLRGMVRLIVGACINFALDKITFEEVKEALDEQIRLSNSWSVPAEGLFLKEIKYPETIFFVSP